MPNKMERFTVRAKRVLLFAQGEAEKRQHSLIDTEHILLGIVREPSSLAIRALGGLDIQQIEAAMEEVSPANAAAPTQPLDLSPQVKELLQLSVHEALGVGHHYISTEHFLLALLSQTDTKAIQILQRAGLNLDTIHRTTQNILSGKSPEMVDVFGSFIDHKRFSGSVKSALTWTQIKAEDLNCKLLDTHHLFLGLLQSESLVVQQVFTETGITYEKVMAYWLQTPAEPEPKEPQLSPAFQQVFKQAVAEADAVKHWWIGPEHFLLGLMHSPEGEVANLLACLGTNPQTIREHTFQAIRQNPYKGPVAAGRFVRLINRVFGLDL